MKKLFITGFLSLTILAFINAQDTTIVKTITTEKSTTVAPPETTVAPTAPAPVAAPAPVVQRASESSPSMMFGLKFCPSFNWLSIDRAGYSSDGGYLGYVFGVMTDFRITDNYYFATGIEASQRGGKYKYDGIPGLGSDSAIRKVTQRLQYLDIPVALKLKTNEIGYSKYYGSFGVIPGFLIKANNDIDYNSNMYVGSKKSSNMSDFGFFNFGFLVGLGMEYKFSGNSAINVGLNYQNSVVDVWSTKKATMKPHYVALNIGLFF